MGMDDGRRSASSSSFYGASGANAPNVLQPYWLIVLPLDVPDLTASLLIWGPSGQRWRCLWTLLFSNFPTFTTSRLQEILAAKGGTTWARNGRWILPENARLPLTFRELLHAVNLRHGTDGLTSPPEEGVLRVFSPWKIQRLRSGLNPRTWVPKASRRSLFGFRTLFGTFAGKSCLNASVTLVVCPYVHAPSDFECSRISEGIFAENFIGDFYWTKLKNDRHWHKKMRVFLRASR